jgi:hypothetical protein
MEKHLKDCLARRTAAAAQLAKQQPNMAAEQVTQSLVYGMNTLRRLLFERIHRDVEENVGHDSMLLPVSVEKTELAAKNEIESFQVSVAALFVRDKQYVDCDTKWFVSWLASLRLEEAIDDTRWRRRIRHYLAMSDDELRLGFSRNLENVFPEARLAPLILYRLFPLSVRIVTAVAFGQHLDAAELRNRQTFWLPAIGDCPECHGRPLDNGDSCAGCGNPIWTYQWLCAD